MLIKHINWIIFQTWPIIYKKSLNFMILNKFKMLNSIFRLLFKMKEHFSYRKKRVRKWSYNRTNWTNPTSQTFLRRYTKSVRKIYPTIVKCSEYINTRFGFTHLFEWIKLNALTDFHTYCIFINILFVCIYTKLCFLGQIHTDTGFSLMKGQLNEI